ncbi:MAG: type II toxin-antitoxin system mRNA interferase toxin, RelE/StbE family [Nitrospirae bacterium CG_4_10_14_0_8_um_filter_41_23]|nr:type II toxin-antitoxin system RelE/ParE family toxin [Nitrospirota bacterium]PIQ95187.1 MAG: type II toxin-antitoxin system mRNA interferase toxin, RelE/StbE family [Nitrospirae bacterium CG11_big_fil_rev_8_21_14_0_20_41_14]PIV41932.1 MAG: type II toxin-antitoxin system mRNA interferase toxin, RelE/StbE family [Nitrospirae bacterium CG02_land_8_20_14_3_00_41_53]PIW87243.1 MAG: type II toxin-antitoxin system mRNA interferase toxin, RelE/StbE family [Nitrospirae bacterium CG_4_8_14_3_um_filter
MYRVEFTSQAEDDLVNIDRTIAQRITVKIDWLSQNMEHIIAEPLSGKFKGKYKLRVGDWRIVYLYNSPEQVITIYAIEHRSKVYKD